MQRSETEKDLNGIDANNDFVFFAGDRITGAFNAIWSTYER